MDEQDRDRLLIEEIDRGNQAESLLGNHLFNEAIESISEELNRRLLATAPEESAMRELCFMELRATAHLVSVLKRQIETGKLAITEREYDRVQNNRKSFFSTEKDPFGAI